MSTVTEHYARLLAPVYLWMNGGAETALAAGSDEIDALDLPAGEGRVAIDLGAGFGMHAIPLARRGWRVVAVDTSAELLQTLDHLCNDSPVTAVQDDLLNFASHVAEAPSVVLCMGDTLTHLADASHVERLFDGVARILPSGGMFVLTFRDYTTPLVARQRFIPARSDDERILTCFLEYGDDHVDVYDILHQRSEDAWQMSDSSYSKLRLSPEKVAQALSATGFEVRQEAGMRGMVRLVARRT